ncbi:hypothetical protein BJV82DRAFT_662873 [Fennellomyces sp. T-0311]|nr:hypothetical protein BJV82DRAFT_662873 [Fennellomyces sp. T-0311]
MKSLSKRDQLECLCVCKEWYRRFFVMQSHETSFKHSEQIQSFIARVKCATQLLGTSSAAASVTTITISDNVQFLSMMDPFQEIFTLCQHIKVLDLSWWQLYVFLMTDADDGYKATKNLGHLRRLTIRRISNVVAARTASYYRYMTMVAHAAKHPENQLAIFERAAYKVPELTDLLQYTPSLECLSLIFDKAYDIQISEQDLEAIHSHCPKLRQLSLTKVTLYLANNTITGPISDYYTAAKQMKYFALKAVHFDELEQPLLHDYIAFKYQSVTTLDIWQAQIREDGYSQTIARSFFWPHLERVTFNNATEDTFSICRSIVAQVGRCSSFTFLAIGGWQLPGSKRNRKTHIITVDLEWLKKTCPYLRCLTLTNARLQGTKGSLTFGNSRSFTPGQVVKQLVLQRTKLNGGNWVVKSYQ